MRKVCVIVEVTVTFFPSTWCTMDRGSPERSRVGGLISCPLSLVSVCTHSQTIPPTHHFSSIYSPPPSLCECSLSLLSSSPSISMYQSSIPVTLHVSIPPPCLFLSFYLSALISSYTLTSFSLSKLFVLWIYQTLIVRLIYATYKGVNSWITKKKTLQSDWLFHRVDPITLQSLKSWPLVIFKAKTKLKLPLISP